MYHKLILSGGGSGILKILYSLEVLEDKGLLDINEFYGTSAGSIISLLLSTGFSVKSSIKIIEKIDPIKILTPDSKMFLNLWTSKGITDNSKIGQIIDIFLQTACKNENITFLEHFNKTNKHFCVFATNVSKQNTLTFNHIDTPNMKVRDAILMSCNIPFLFKPMIYEDNIVCDGCLSSHFPVNYLSKDNTNSADAVADDDENKQEGTDILGIQIIPELFDFDFKTTKNPMWFLHYIYSLLIVNVRETQKLIKNLCSFDVITIEHNFLKYEKNIDYSAWKENCKVSVHKLLEKKNFKASRVNTE